MPQPDVVFLKIPRSISSPSSSPPASRRGPPPASRFKWDVFGVQMTGFDTFLVRAAVISAVEAIMTFRMGRFWCFASTFRPFAHHRTLPRLAWLQVLTLDGTFLTSEKPISILSSLSPAGGVLLHMIQQSRSLMQCQRPVLSYSMLF